jgi:hypothetical protein
MRKRMLRLLDSKTHIFFPSEEKDTRFQASLSSLLQFGTMPAPPSNGFFHPKAFAKYKHLFRWGKSCVFSESIGLSFLSSR